MGGRWTALRSGKRISSAILTLVAVVGLTSIQVQGQGQTGESRSRRIAIFGSSVANGTGDESNREGYTGLLREMLAPRGWTVVNVSRGGDTTARLAQRFAPDGAEDPDTRYLLPANPRYVVFGLSLGNEGLFEAGTIETKEAVYRQYAEGMKGFVDMARQHDLVPIVTLAYPRADFTAVEYEYVRRINLLQNSWDVPSVNLLGAIDDGHGRWAAGFFRDLRHPNAAGFTQVFYAFVPTLFDALEAGKPTPARPAGAPGFARIAGATAAPLIFEPGATMNPFAIGVMVRAEEDGTVAAVTGRTLAAATGMKVWRRTPASNPLPFQSTTLTPDRPFTATIGVQNDRWTYTAADGTTVRSAITADGQWHHVVLSHYTARGETLFFVDGQLIGTVDERLEPGRFVLGGPGSAAAPAAPPQADYKDLFVFRAALNADEVAALRSGTVLQASLEIYAPLNDAGFRPGSALENRAQSLAQLQASSAGIVPVEADGQTD